MSSQSQAADAATEKDLHTERDGVPEGYRVVHIDPETEKRVVKKMDWIIIPLVTGAYLLAYMDRSNIGNAQTAGMGDDIGYGEGQYEWLLTIFYISYILFEPLDLMWKIVPPHIWGGFCILIWGISASLQAAAFNWAGVMVCRWFMAAAEASFGPGIPYLLSFFYRRRELGIRCGIFLSAAPLATTFAGALAYGITSGHGSIENWRILMLVEGLPSIVMAIIFFFRMPDSPDTARFLDPEEREVARSRAILQTGGDGKSRIGASGITFREILGTFRHPQTWLQPLMYFSCNVSFASLPVFLPAIIEGLGYKSIDAQGLTAPPFFLSFLVCIITTWVADRTGERGLMIAGLSIIGTIGYVILAASHSIGARYFAVFLAAAGVFPAIANILSWVVNNHGSDTTRGVGIAVLNLIGQCGPILGTRIFPTSEKPYYVKGMAICAAFMAFNTVLALTLRFYFVRANKKLQAAEDAAVAAGQSQDPKSGPVEMEGVTGYRYVL